MKTRILFLVTLLIGIASGAFGQMVPNYSFSNSIEISSDGTTAYFDVSISGTTSCPNNPNGCPGGVYHSGTITDTAGSYGGTYNNIDRVTPTSYLEAGESTEVPLATVGTLKIDMNGFVDCTAVGNIAQGPIQEEYVDKAVTVSKTTSGTSNLSPDCTSATSPPDWGGLTTNPYGVYPTQTSNQYVRAEIMVSSVGGGPPWEPIGNSVHKPQSGSPPFTCTKFPTQVTY